VKLYVFVNIFFAKLKHLKYKTKTEAESLVLKKNAINFKFTVIFLKALNDFV